MAASITRLPLGHDPKQPTIIGQNPRSIEYAEIDWNFVMSIMRAAERGQTERWADLTRRMMGDAHVAACIETRKVVLSQARLAVDPVDPDDPIDVRGAEDAQAMFDGLPMSRAKRDMADAIPTGWACLQILWEVRGAWLWPYDLRWNHPRRFRFSYDFRPYIYDDGRAAQGQDKLSEAERQRCLELNIQGMPLEPDRWIVHMPRAFPDYPNMGGVLRSAVRYWWIKANALRYQLAGAEMGGNGRIIGYNDPDADAATKEQFRKNLENWAADGVIVASPGAKVELMNAINQGSSSVWQTLIDGCNAGESKAILGSTLVVEPGENGNRSLGDTQKQATIDPRAESDEEEIRHTLVHDLVRPFFRLNASWRYAGRIPNVRVRSVWVEEDATVDELVVNAGVVKKDQLLASRGLPPLGPDHGGNDFVTIAGPSFPFQQTPGGASAATPLREGGEHRGALPREAHGDLHALADEARSSALLTIGHPGLLTAQSMLDGVDGFERVRASLLDAAAKSDAASFERDLAAWTKRKAPALSIVLQRSILQARMAGALFVAQYEAPEVFENVRTLAADGGAGWDGDGTPPFLALPFDEAVAAFERRRIVSADEFRAMDEESRRSAFSATRLAHENLVRVAHELLLRTLTSGGTYEDFLRELEADPLGVTPTSPGYLETVFRSNVQGAYGDGRLQIITSPAVAAARPYVERRTARDDRVRDTHAALEGAVFSVTDPGLSDFSPPYLGGAYQFNCRCVVVSRRASDVDPSKVVDTASLSE